MSAVGISGVTAGSGYAVAAGALGDWADPAAPSAVTMTAETPSAVSVSRADRRDMLPTSSTCPCLGERRSQEVAGVSPSSGPCPRTNGGRGLLQPLAGPNRAPHGVRWSLARVAPERSTG